MTLDEIRQQEREYQKAYRKKNKAKYREYMREYMRGRRWLEGGPDNHLLGPHIQYRLRVINGELKI